MRSLLALGIVLLVFPPLWVGPITAIAGEDFDPATKKPLMDMIKSSPNSIPLEPRDPSKDLNSLLRDPKDNPKRKPGPINIQKTVG
jgi:hypothetical protein